VQQNWGTSNRHQEGVLKLNGMLLLMIFMSADTILEKHTIQLKQCKRQKLGSTTSNLVIMIFNEADIPGSLSVYLIKIDTNFNI
jgi:hypothetical protein